MNLHNRKAAPVTSSSGLPIPASKRLLHSDAQVLGLKPRRSQIKHTQAARKLLARQIAARNKNQLSETGHH